MAAKWYCQTCTRNFRLEHAYPPHPDVHCAFCGDPLTPDERVIAILRLLADEPRSGTHLARSAAEPPIAAHQLLTIGEVAALLRTTPKAIYTRVERGQLPGVTRDRGRLRVRRDALLKYLRENSVPSPGEPQR